MKHCTVKMSLLLSCFTITSLLTGCTQNINSDATNSLAKSNIVVAEENIQDYFMCGETKALVNLHPEIQVDNFAMQDLLIRFDYQVGDLGGEAILRPSYTRHLEDRNKFNISTMELTFEFRANNVLLNIYWEMDGSKDQDVFFLDASTNLWVYQWPSAHIFPVILDEEQASRLFPEIELTENYLDTFICSETLYDVSFYRVSDFDNIYGPDVQLAHFPEYNYETLFLWQTDEMYKWHISIEYTDAGGNTYWWAYITKNYRYLNPTLLIPLNEPDWNTSA